jgi:Protein RETICULATA-related
MRFTLPQVGIGICTKTAAEATKRGVNFPHELDFVTANIIMALVADFCLVWLPAPRANWRCSAPPKKRNHRTLWHPPFGIPNASRAVASVVDTPLCALLRLSILTGMSASCRSGEDAPLPALQSSPVYSFVQSCPGNCFQTVQPGTPPYSLQQRAGALAINFAKLLAVGTTASLVGVGIVNGLTALRQAADPGWTPLNPPQNILATSLLYGTYMGVSSNLRSGRRTFAARGICCRHLLRVCMLARFVCYSCAQVPDHCRRARRYAADVHLCTGSTVPWLYISRICAWDHGAHIRP